MCQYCKSKKQTYGFKSLKFPNQYDELKNFGHSVKDIPVPSRKEYQTALINSYENFIWPLRWRVFHFKNPNCKSKKQTYGFKSLKFPNQYDELKDFEEDLRDLILNI